VCECLLPVGFLLLNQWVVRAPNNRQAVEVSSLSYIAD